MNNNHTKDWELYLAGKKYNNALKPNYYDTVNVNYEFFHDNQWLNLDADENMPKPTFNIIKRIISFLIASLTTSKTRLHFEPLINSEEENEEIAPSKIANAQIQNLFEKFKMDFLIKESLFSAAIAGDVGAHFYFDMSKKPYGGVGRFKDIKGEISVELVDGVNVYFGNANTHKVEDQPYIIIAGRDTVKNLQDEAKQYKQSQETLDNITQDKDYEEQAGGGGKIEVESDEHGKALFIIVYRKEKVMKKVTDEFGNETEEEVEIIKASKSVENAYIYKDIETDLTRYPFAWLTWEKQKNQYHGRALCTSIIPNQIFINRMFAMVMFHQMLNAFPKPVYNSDVIPYWNNAIGEAIAVKGLGSDLNVNNVATYLEPGDMSNQIVQVLELAMQYTKETLGISDNALGNIKPDNTSAIIAVQKSSAIPLENPRSNLYEWIEEIGEILFDFMGTYYGKRPIVVDNDGQKEIVDYDFSTFKNMWLSTKADVGETSYWSEIASLETLGNLLANQHIDFMQYLDRVPDELIPQKDKLLSELNERLAQYPQTPENDPHELVAQLSPEEQEQFYNSSPDVQERIISQLQTPAM